MVELERRLYRHYRGKYYLVTDVAFDGEQGVDKIVCTDLQSGDKFILSRTDFFSDVHDLEDNTTGQSLRFEPVKDFQNQLDLINTDNLVKELMRRNDNPFAGIDVESVKNNMVFLSEYVVGTVTYADLDNGETEIFSTYSTYQNIELAREKCAKLGGRYKVMKRVFLKVDS